MKDVKRTAKGALKSKTMWFSFFIVMATWLANHSSAIVAILPDDYQEVAGYVIGLAVALLRLVTTKPLDEK